MAVCSCAFADNSQVPVSTAGEIGDQRLMTTLRCKVAAAKVPDPCTTGSATWKGWPSVACWPQRKLRYQLERSLRLCGWHAGRRTRRVQLHRGGTQQLAHRGGDDPAGVAGGGKRADQRGMQQTTGCGAALAESPKAVPKLRHIGRWRVGWQQGWHARRLPVLPGLSRLLQGPLLQLPGCLPARGWLQRLGANAGCFSCHRHCGSRRPQIQSQLQADGQHLLFAWQCLQRRVLRQQRSQTRRTAGLPHWCGQPTRLPLRAGWHQGRGPKGTHASSACCSCSFGVPGAAQALSQAPW